MGSFVYGVNLAYLNENVGVEIADDGFANRLLMLTIFMKKRSTLTLAYGDGAYGEDDRTKSFVNRSY